MPHPNGVLKGAVPNGAAPRKPEMDYINYGEEDEMKAYGYKYSPVRAATTWVCIALTAGFLRLVFHWCPQWMLYCMYKRCSLNIAERVLFEENFQGRYTIYHIEDVKTITLKKSRSKHEHPKDEKELVRIYLASGSYKDIYEINVVWVKKLCYVWDERSYSFYKLCGLDNGVTGEEFHFFKGYSEREQRLRRVVYGLNEIGVPMQSVLTLLFLEIINPFYIFQVFTLVVWVCEKYYYYTGAIIIMSVFGVTSSIIQTRRNQRSLYETVTSTSVVSVWRGDDRYEDIPSSELVPGDVFIIPKHGCAMQCDAVLLNGSCIVNESMLTGESVPVTKTAMTRVGNAVYSAKEDTNHTLFCGTKVIQTRYYNDQPVKAVVLRTGYLTAKGSLVRSILYPPPADFKFDQDTYKFIFILAIIAILGVIYTVVYKVLRNLPAGDVAIKALDIITIVVPPALPATMTMGKLYGQKRLQAAKIYCINSRVINVSGSLDCVCFDKTGTLTEDGLDMWGVVPSEERQFQPPVKSPDGLKSGPLMEGMACCHSITVIDDELSGDPLDVKMFEFTKWALEEPKVDDNSKFDIMVPTIVKQPECAISSQVPREIGVVHQFQFSSTLQRMSVITRSIDSPQFIAYCKGSPEMIVSLSKPETVPMDLISTLQEYTVSGYRVLALGYCELEETNYHRIQRLARDEVEKDLTFVGLIILENRLKPQTTDVIRQLKLADVRTIMITGDNIQTAISVARECGIVDANERVIDVTALDDASQKVYFTNADTTPRPQTNDSRYGSINDSFVPDSDDPEIGVRNYGSYKFAVNGRSWGIIRDNMPELLPKIVTRGAVFARMSSEQKQQLVLELKELGYYVAMCGDGANDCGALKAAHAGISLSEAEASVASPFTSREANISCVPKVIREGRAALVTAFGIFKFMVTYSLAEFLSTAILYYIDSNLADFQFLFIDICLVVNFALFFGNTHAYAGQLVKQTPTTSLYSLPPMASLAIQIIIIVVFQVISLVLVKTFPWFTPYQYEYEKYASYENYAIFAVSMFQYITIAIVFSHGAPYRKSIFTNYFFVGSLSIMTAICVYITVYPATWVSDLLELKLPKGYNFRVIVLCLGLVNFLIALFMERCIVQYLLFQKLGAKRRRKQTSTLKYLKINEELLMDYNWPPITPEFPLVPSKSFDQLTPRPVTDIPIVVGRTTEQHKNDISMITQF